MRGSENCKNDAKFDNLLLPTSFAKGLLRFCCLPLFSLRFCATREKLPF